VKKFYLDAAKFKKVKADEHSSTLRHSDGHEIRIAHKGLSPKMHEALKALPLEHLAAGGLAGDTLMAGDDSAHADTAPDQQPAQQPEATQEPDQAQQTFEKAAAEPIPPRGTISIPSASRLSYVNNNPGNLKFAKQRGAEPGEGGFAKFESPEAGAAALLGQIHLDASRGLNLRQFVTKYAPPSDKNDTEGYIKYIANATGGSDSTKLTDLSPEHLRDLIMMRESGTRVRGTEKQPAPSVAIQPTNVSSDWAQKNPEAIKRMQDYMAQQGQAPASQPSFMDNMKQAFQDFWSLPQNQSEAMKHGYGMVPAGIGMGAVSSMGGQTPPVTPAPAEQQAQPPQAQPTAAAPSVYDDWMTNYTKDMNSATDAQKSILDAQKSGEEAKKNYYDTVANKLDQMDPSGQISDIQHQLADNQNRRAQYLQTLSDFKINPKRVIEHMSTGDKILQGIGFVLGGLGSAIGGGPNLAAKFFQDRVDQDIDAQKSDLANKQNLLHHNLTEMGDLRSAMAMTRVNLLDSINAHLSSLQAQTGSAMIEPLKQQIQAQANLTMDQLKAQMAMRQYLMQPAGTVGQSQQSEEDAFAGRQSFLRTSGYDKLADSEREMHIPGFGQATRKPTEEDISLVQDLRNLAKTAADGESFINQHKVRPNITATIFPGDRARGESLSANMTTLLNKALGSKRLSETALKEIEKITPDLKSFNFTDADQAKMRRVGELITEQLNSVLNTVGINRKAAYMPTSIVNGRLVQGGLVRLLPNGKYGRVD
jgi:hypothetical protein